MEKNIQAFGSVRSSIGQSSSGTLLGSELSSIGGDDFAKLIIMDRGMDLKTPLMHDLTFLVSLFYCFQYSNWNNDYDQICSMLNMSKEKYLALFFVVLFILKATLLIHIILKKIIRVIQIRFSSSCT